MKSSNDLKSKSKEELIQLIGGLNNEVDTLKENLRLALSARFAKRSEKSNTDDRQENLFDEPEITKSVEQDENAGEITVKLHQRKKTGRKPLPDYLPRIQKIYGLDESEKQCSCGCKLTEIKPETSEQFEFIPAKVRVIQHVRKKYVCKGCEETIKTAAAPKLAIPKSIASASLLSHIIVSEYADHLPLYRQESILQRHGIVISRGSLANWMIKCADLFKPLIKLMKDEIVNYDVAFADETVMQVLKEPDRPPDRKSYM